MNNYVLGGSVDLKNGYVRGAVFKGNSEWDINHSLRYVKGVAKNGETFESCLFRIYDNSTGCLLRGNFIFNEQV